MKVNSPRTPCFGKDDGRGRHGGPHCLPGRLSRNYTLHILRNTGVFFLKLSNMCVNGGRGEEGELLLPPF